MENAELVYLLKLRRLIQEYCGVTFGNLEMRGGGGKGSQIVPDLHNEHCSSSLFKPSTHHETHTTKARRRTSQPFGCFKYRFYQETII